MKNSKFMIFMKNAFLFSIPLILFFAILDTVAIKSGELTSVKNIVNIQNNTDEVILYGRKVVDQELRKYKYEMYNNRQSDIIAIGSSRILSIREEFFLPHYSFTNLGSMAHSIGDVEDFADRLATSSSAKHIIFGPDYYWFGSHKNPKSDLTYDLGLLSASVDWRAHKSASRYVAESLIKNYTLVFNFFRESNLYHKSFGFQGREGNGYRKDGSYLYSIFLKELRRQNVYRDREQPSIIDRVKSGSGSFEFDSHFENDRLVILDRILKKLKQKNYYVIGLGLPYSTEVYSELMTNPRQNELFMEYQKKIPLVFSKNNFVYFDYANLKKINLDDLFMFDGVHPSETASANILIDVLQKLDKNTFKYRDLVVSHLKKLINSSKTTSFELDKDLLRVQ